MKPLRTQPPCPFLYDALGGRTHFAVAGVLDVAYEYDVRNRLVEILGNGKATRFDYDAAGQRTNAVWPNGTYASYAYDDAGQLLSLIHGRANPPGEPLASFTYAYDLSGNRTHMITLEGTNSYSYDDRNWLTSAAYPDGTTEIFAYDPVGNRTSLATSVSGGPVLITHYDYGLVNRLQSSASAVETNVYVYDDAGRLATQAVADQSRTYGYDFMSRMTSLTDTNGSVFAYAFDGEGNRVRQSLNDCLSTRFVYDGANAVVEMNGSNEVVWAWIHGPGVDQPVERIAFINEKARTRQVVHADGLGSVAALTDENGEPVQTYVYNAFGGIRANSGTDLNRVTFTAREAMGDSLGFHYYRHRIYDPHTGRFTSEDPLGFVDGANRYVYCGNNPVNIVDPFGLAWYDNWHYEGRDAHNSNLPSSPEAADLAGGTLLSPEMSKYHDDPCTPGPEKKFIFPGGEEAVYNDETGQLVTDPRYKGTYNYVNPAPPSRNPLKWPGIVGRGAGHFFADMLPYYIWGNERPSEDESDHCK